MLGNQKTLGKLRKIRMATCPPATQDIPTNLKNRQKCIDDAHYGPLNPNEPNPFCNPELFKTGMKW